MFRALIGKGWSAYLRAVDEKPLKTAVLTSSTLWFTGDIIAQTLEMKSKPKSNEPQNYDLVRLGATVSEGTLMGGAVGLKWYNTLDHFVLHTLKLKYGSFRFVASKLALECAIWHPLSLFVFWVWVGKAEGHHNAQIRDELRRDFFPTLFGDMAIWAPIDIVNFWKVPVHLQVLVINCGCLFEAVALSYIHEHGFPGMEKPAHAEDSLFQHEKPAGLGGLLVQSTPDPAVAQAEARRTFRRITHGKGYLTVRDMDEYVHGAELPGLRPGMLSATVALLLLRKMQTSGSRVSEAEYMALLQSLYETDFRQSHLADVVFALFDANGDGYIDAKEFGKYVQVFSGGADGEAKARALLNKYDENKDGRLSLDEIRKMVSEL